MKLHQLWIVVVCVGLCHTLCEGQESQRRIILRKAYLVIPIENNADACPVTISFENELVTCATVELARKKADFWTFVDLGPYTGPTGTFSATNPPRGFHAIHSTDCIPGAENLHNEKYRPRPCDSHALMMPTNGL